MSFRSPLWFETIRPPLQWPSQELLEAPNWALIASRHSQNAESRPSVILRLYRPAITAFLVVAATVFFFFLGNEVMVNDLPVSGP